MMWGAFCPSNARSPALKLTPFIAQLPLKVPINNILCKGASLNDVRSLGGRGVSKNLTLLNKISKFYTIKV